MMGVRVQHESLHAIRECDAQECKRFDLRLTLPLILLAKSAH
jgi:hypothetical protein